MNLAEHLKLLIDQIYRPRPPLDEDIKAMAKALKEDAGEQKPQTQASEENT